MHESMSLKYEPSSKPWACYSKEPRWAETGPGKRSLSHTLTHTYSFSLSLSLARSVPFSIASTRGGLAGPASLLPSGVRVGHLWRDEWTALSGPLSRVTP